MDWIISSLATAVSIVSTWLYGNQSRKAPWYGLVMCLIWVYYDIKYDQLPLLLPTFLTMTIQIRNLIKMRGELT